MNPAILLLTEFRLSRHYSSFTIMIQLKEIH